ncbi:SDR family NAD(P)-dependent oxidoreductase [Nonomuraea sp. NPDC049129]|uniref:SDR family NAD(P)-dependent oxidoreductase n=1 Tax=Nonomuraea sp. NPDC049129 TaxID=3155272 RepID=UPI003411306F
MTRAGTILLTGATGGIGSAIATTLLDAGYRVLALVRDPARLSELAASGGLATSGELATSGGVATVDRPVGPGAMDEVTGPGSSGRTTGPGGADRTAEPGGANPTPGPGGTDRTAGHGVDGIAGPDAMDGIAGLGEITPVAANLPWPEIMTPAVPTVTPAEVSPTTVTHLDVTPAGFTPGSVIAIVADLARPETLAAALPPIGELDAFVHCAAIAEVTTTADSTVELWRDTLNVNVASAAELLRLLLPALRRSRGRVILINAAPGLSPQGWPAYAASKAALRELGDAVRDEEQPHGIRVTTIYPGATATELLRKVRTGFGSPYNPDRCLPPAAVASMVLTALTAPPQAHLAELSVLPAP